MKYAVLHPKLERRLKELEGGVQLPVFPAICAQIRRATEDSRLGSAQVAALVEKEPTLTLKVLRSANSPFHGASKEVTSVKQAISMLGMQSIADMAMASALSRVLPMTPGARRLEPDRFWGHSIAVAFTASALAKMSPVIGEESAAEVFTAGLVHDMGKLLMQQYWPVEYARALEGSSHDGTPMRMAEKQIFGFSHQDMGAWLVDSWELPRDLVMAVTAHDTPEDLDVSDSSYPIVALVHVANLLVHFLQLGSSGDHVVPKLSAAAWEMLKIDIQRIPDLCKATRTHALELSRQLRN